MEFVDGLSLDNLVAENDEVGKKIIRRKLIQVFSDMYFVYSLVHNDPHKGNLMYRIKPDTKEYELIILDRKFLNQF